MEAWGVILSFEHTVMHPLGQHQKQTPAYALTMDECLPWEVAQSHGVQNAFTPHL